MENNKNAENAQALVKLNMIVVYVKKMREFQKAFFKNKHNSDLQNAKDLEKRVDQMITEYDEMNNPQIKMF